MRMIDIIARKRDGAALTPDEIVFFIEGYTRGDLPDYQAAALLMAVYLRGMDAAETDALTAAMAGSGARLDLGTLDGPVLDKHSTGGVGDKTSLVVVPILAACGVPVCKMSGRGLGHTGGTLDKLQSIPGFRVDLGPEALIDQVRRVGACLAGQTADLAPADKKLYALRDATATVGSLPLIASSILSKKLAGGADAFVFDVKVGSGAFLPGEQEARELAQALVNGARARGRRAVALLTDMNEPLGRAVGNALEVREAIEVLTPGAEACPRLRALCVALAAEGLALAGKEEPAAAAERALAEGRAREALRAIIAAQKGDGSVVDDPGRVLPRAPVIVPARAGAAGYVAAVDAARLGRIVVGLGGGRARKEDDIDPRVGLIVQKRVGQPVAAGDTLALIHAAAPEEAAAVLSDVTQAYHIQAEPAPPPPLLLGRVAG